MSRDSVGPKLMLAAVSAAFSLAVLEAAVRFLPDSQSLLLRPSEIPGLAYGLEPGSVALMPPGRFSVDSYGFRYPEFPREKPSGEFRAFALGDSIVFGQGTAKGDFSALLEEDLNATPPKGYSSARVVNTGVPSYSTCQELALLTKRLEPEFRPDLVLVGYATNDPEGARVPFGLDLATGRIAPWWRAYHWVKGRSALTKYVATKLAPAVVRLRGRGGFAPPVDPQQEVRYVATLHDPAGAWWPKCAACLQGLGEYRKAGGAPVLVVVFPLFDHLDSPELSAAYARVEKTAKDAGLDALNLEPLFRKLPKETVARIQGDGMHPTEEGHALVAGMIRDYLAAHPALLKGRE